MLVISLFGVGVCAVFGMLIGMSPFDSSSAAGPPENAEAPTLGDPIALVAAAPNSAVPLPAVSLALAPAPILQAEFRAEIEPEAKTMREASTDISEAVSPRVTEGVLKRGDTLARSLTGQGVSARVVDQIARKMIGH